VNTLSGDSRQGGGLASYLMQKQEISGLPKVGVAGYFFLLRLRLLTLRFLWSLRVLTMSYIRRAIFTATINTSYAVIIPPPSG